MALNPTQNGISPITGLRYDPSWTPEQRAALDAESKQLRQERAMIKKGINASYQPEVGSFTESQHYQPGTPGYEKGLSQYDKKSDVFTPVTSFDDLQQRRYEAQPWYDVAANGIAKAVGRAATSFITGIAGSVAGIGTMLYNRYDTGEWNIADLWDNPLSNALADLDEWADQNLVNYKSIVQQQNEQNGEWYKNLSGLNMIMDDIVTNFGFIVGMGAAAAVTGGVGGAVAGAARRGAASVALRNSMGSIAKGVKAARIADKYGQTTAKALTLINSSAGEAALEGLQVKREMVKEETDKINAAIDQHIAEDPNIQTLDSEYNNQMASLEQDYLMRPKDAQYQQYKDALTQQYQKQRSQLSEQWEQRRQAALQELDESSDRAGNATALLNMAILLPSNFNMYGRLIDKSFRNAEKSAGRSWAVKNGQIHSRNALNQQNIIGSIQNQSWDAIRGNAKNYGSRTFLGNVSKHMASTAFSEGIYEEMGQSAASTGAKAYHEWNDADNYWRARLDPDSIDRFVDGSHDFLSALGQGLSETYGSVDGWREGFIGAISGMAWGMGETRDEWRDTRYAKRAAKDLNKQLQNDRLPNLLQHIIAQSYHDNIKEGYARMNDQGAWKTEDDKAAYALVSAFDRAGRMEDLQHLISSYAEQMSDQDVEDMINSSTRTVSSQEQINQMKQEIRKNTAEKVESALREGATMDDYMRVSAEIEDKDAAVSDADAVVVDARQKAADELSDTSWLHKPISELRTMARRARDPQKKTAAQAIVAAHNTYQQALEDARYARAQRNTMHASTDSEARIQEALEEYNRLNDAADNSAPEEYMDGPFVTSNGANVMGKDEVRDTLKHNTDRINQVVDRYRKAVEKVNRDTRGVLSKDQEDYLAYAQFMAESSGFRAQEMVEKWRGILPEVLTVRHKNKSTAAKFAGVQESQVEEDPNNPGVFRINTRGMTDSQFATFVLHGLLKQSHVNDKNDTGDGALTEDLRKSLAEEALDEIEREHDRTGRRDTFDREQLRQDFEAIDDYFKKNEEYAKAYMEALSNPESIMTAKDKAMRYLKRKYDQAKNAIAQKKKNIDDIIAEGDEAIAASTPYQQAQIRLKRLIDAVDKFFTKELNDVFKNISDPELRAELVDKTKAYINSLIKSDETSNEPHVLSDDEVNDAGTIMAYMTLDDIDEDGSIASRVTDDVLKQINKALAKFRATTKGGVPWAVELLRRLNKCIKAASEAFDRIVSAGKSAVDTITASSSFKKISEYAKNLFRLANSDSVIKGLESLQSVLEQKITSLEGKNSKTAKIERKGLKTLLSQVKARLASLRNSRQPEGGVADPEQQSNDTTGQVASEPEPVIQAPDNTQQETPFQNPSEEQEDDAMRKYMSIEFKEGSIGGNIWQTVTGEFSRRSNFEYVPYHTIIDREIAGKQDNESVTIDGLGRETVETWKRYAERSRIVHARMSNDGSFNYVAEGNVHRGNPVEFLITKDDTVGTIVYILHTDEKGVKHIIGDLNHHEYGAKDSDGSLAAIYSIFDEEYAKGTIDPKLGGVISAYHSTVANVFAGFPKYKSGAEKGTAAETTVSEISDKPVRFHIIGANIPQTVTGDIHATGRIGQPCMLIPRPGNDGLTRWRAVPVKTRPIAETSSPKYGNTLIARVLQQAVKNLSRDELIDFLKHFLNCESVFFDARNSESQQTVIVDGEPVKKDALVFNVVLRSKNASSESLKTSITIAKDGNGFAVGGSVRCNVSARLLSNPALYQKVIKGDSSLPTTYNDFLKEICYTKLVDTQSHNNWVTINKLVKTVDGKLTEVADPAVNQSGPVTIVGKDTVNVRDEVSGITTQVVFTKNKFGVTAVKAVRQSRGTDSFADVTVDGSNISRILRHIATAYMQLGGGKYGQINYVEFGGVVYQFVPQHGKIGAVTFSDNKTIQYTQDEIDKRLPAIMSSILRHYNGSNIDTVIKEFFNNDIKNPETFKAALKTLLDDMRNGKTVLSGISLEQKAEIVNNIKDRGTDKDMQRINLFRKLKQRLSKHINIIEDLSEGQRVLLERATKRMQSGDSRDLLEYGKEAGVKFFLSADGNAVYGFFDEATGNIYVDPDLISPDVLIHEYTHMWCNVLRRSETGKAIWENIVKDLKSETAMWNKVKATYGTSVQKEENGIMVDDDDAIAEEVFAHLSGSEGEKWMEQHLAEVDNKDAVIGKIRGLVNKIIDFIKSLFGAGKYARTMRELVWWDMLSDSPLDNFDVITNAHDALKDDAVEEQKPEEEKPSQQESNKVPIMALISGTDLSYDDAIEVLKDEFNLTDDKFANGNVILDPSITDEMLRDVGLNGRPKGVKPFVSVGRTTPVLIVPMASRINELKRSNPSISITDAIDSIEDGLTSAHFSFNDFLSAISLGLNSKQRTALWGAVKAGLNVDTNYEVAAELPYLFTKFLQSGTSDNSQVDALFSILRQSLSELIRNKEAVALYDKLSDSTPVIDATESPTDPVSVLSDQDRILAAHEYLDKLTDRDAELLTLAGYPIEVYKTLLDSSKERIRKCVL